MGKGQVSRDALPICHGDCGALTPEEAWKRLRLNLSIPMPGGDIVSDLISRDALLDTIYGDKRPEVYDGQDIANWQMKCINTAPSVDAEPVRHGYWIPDNHACGYYMSGYICSRCKQCSLEGGEFCHNCGAKMDLE